jgi:hypothetical protein
MARNMKASWQIMFSAATKKKNTQKKRLPAYALEKTPQHTSTQNQSKTLKLSTNIIKQQTYNTSTACAAAGKIE